MPNNIDDEMVREPSHGAKPVVIGIGASAGGVRALQHLFEALPEKTGGAFVVVVHLDPETRSEMSSILAARTKMPVAQLKNAAGNYVTATPDSVTTALSSATIPDDFRFSMTNAAGADSYPISGVTWLLVYQKQTDAEKGKKMVEFLKWALTTGEDMAKPLDYAPLPQPLRDRVLKRIAEIQVGG